MKRRKSKVERLRPVSKLAVLAEEGKEFDNIFYKGASGCQPGAWVEVMKGELRASLRVERKLLEKEWGYGATETEESRIGYLLITNESPDKFKHYGTWDPNELIRRPRHNFDTDPEPVKTLAKLVLKYFSK